ncbi:MAG: ABC transporter ATP-binding protein [Prevotella sp.]|nr:ABC transporter ATP-binding protein [Prevotella sp.]
MSNLVEVNNLSHRYYTQWAIRDINFEINNRGVYGLLGSNGAGKSTTMNIMCGVLSQTEGDVLINGINTKENPIGAKMSLGFLPQKPPLYLDLTVEEYLTHCAMLRRMESKTIKKAVEEVMERCRIAHFAKRLLRNLSGGYQQRVGIAQAIIHNPALVVFDEPTNGLDPVQILEIRKLINEIAQDRAVLVSTHILQEVQATCEHIFMIERGNMVFHGTLEEFDNQVQPDSLLVETGHPVDMEQLKALPGQKLITRQGDCRYRISYTDKETLCRAIVEMSLALNWDLKELTPERQSLDVVFAKLSGKTLEV